MDMRGIFYFLPVLLLLPSCNKDSKQDWSGMEYSMFEVSGKVTDANGTPIKDISVSASGSETFTLSDGSYLLKGTGGKQAEVFLSFADKDGDANGGLFMSDMKAVKLEYAQGAHGPFLGLFKKSDVNVVLTSVILPGGPDTDFDVPIQ